MFLESDWAEATDVEIIAATMAVHAMVTAANLD